MSDETKIRGRHKKVAYYPGCALEGTGHSYNRSTKAVGKALGLDLVELKDWNCCGAMEVKNIDPKIQTYLSARNLDIADKMGFDTVMAPCNGCYHNLKKAEYDLAHDEASKEVNHRLSSTNFIEHVPHLWIGEVECRKRYGDILDRPGQPKTLHRSDHSINRVGSETIVVFGSRLIRSRRKSRT